MTARTGLVRAWNAGGAPGETLQAALPQQRVAA